MLEEPLSIKQLAVLDILERVVAAGPALPAVVDWLERCEVASDSSQRPWSLVRAHSAAELAVVAALPTTERRVPFFLDVARERPACRRWALVALCGNGLDAAAQLGEGFRDRQDAAARVDAALYLELLDICGFDSTDADAELLARARELVASA